jgi:branched-chain amino acid transport system substrate-binding protein
MRSRTVLVVVALLVALGGVVVYLRTTHQIGPPPAITIGVDLPYQGANNDPSTQTFNAMKLYLDQHGGKVGDYSVSLFNYDDSTPTNTTGDPQRCTSNANEAVARADLVAVIGPHQVACARAEAKVFAAAAMTMISPAVTNPGLTTAWDAGEPAAYTANGVRAFARVVPTDDEQGAAAALYAAQTAKVHNCFVLNDGETYGKKLAQRFIDTARTAGVTVTDAGTWNKADTSYLAMFAGNEGMDCVYLAGNFDNNGAELVSDKVALLGDNDRVKLFVPDGFGVYPAFAALPAAQHAYATTPGLTMDGWRSLNGPAKAFLTAYHDKYHADLTTPQAMYGVLALQEVLGAIAASDGTRAGVHKAVFSGAGVSEPAATAIIGGSTGIDPGTGDVTTPVLAVSQVNKNALAFVAATPVKPAAA